MSGLLLKRYAAVVGGAGAVAQVDFPAESAVGPIDCTLPDVTMTVPVVLVALLSILLMVLLLAELISVLLMPSDPDMIRRRSGPC